jgi:FMN-dependent oxidoreductase (nitrilotriacetate monooxygenase family)
MSRPKRQMHFGVFWVGTGNHLAGWRYKGATTSNSYWPAVVESAQIAERGKLDMFFVADSVGMDFTFPPSFLSRHEPTTLLAALSTVTSRIGLGGTVSTSFSEPYNVARAFASIDNISGGRAAWNVVTSSRDSAALNFSQERIKEHDLRYEIASEFVDVVRGLWDTWDDGAIVADTKTGQFLDESKVRELNYKGQFFSVKGPLNIERCPQGHPIIIQAGGSPPGQELSARVADVVFSVVNGDTDLAKTNYNSLKQRMAKYGRDPDDLAILPGVMPIVGETDEQAREQLSLLQSWMKVDEAKALSVLTQRLHFDFSGYSLDAPVPEIPETERGQTFNKTLISMARRENMTLRDLFNVAGAARGHWAICGSPKRIADIFEEWFVGGMADGFVILPAHFPGALADFVNLVVPELQRRGLFRAEYSGPMLRDHLGLKRPEARFAAQTDAAE